MTLTVASILIEKLPSLLTILNWLGVSRVLGTGKTWVNDDYLNMYGGRGIPISSILDWDFPL